MVDIIRVVVWSAALALPQPMATILAPVDSREVVRCDRCDLVQFRPFNNTCRRCHDCLDKEEPIAAMPQPLEPSITVANAPPGHLGLAIAIKSFRLGIGLSQRQLAARMGVPRTYVSKIENKKATPTLSSLERLARALEVTLPQLLTGSEGKVPEGLRALVEDDFVAEILPFVSQLTPTQMSSITAQVREMTTRLQHSS